MGRVDELRLRLVQCDSGRARRAPPDALHRRVDLVAVVQRSLVRTSAREIPREIGNHDTHAVVADGSTDRVIQITSLSTHAGARIHTFGHRERT